ncbi:MAG: DegV family protein [Trueperaceae bacterium]|nr:DegV family protein [Trueperaceae bacterium]
MKLAIVTDSTCDLPAAELEQLDVYRVPLYVNFQGKLLKDWLEINPKDIIAGVAAGAALPSTSQPSPQDFEVVYKQAIAEGATDILCITISSDLSGTFQSANIAAGNVEIPVKVFDSRAASIGLGDMVKEAAKLRAKGKELDSIVKALEHVRDTNYVLFTVASLEYLQKNGRIGGAQALLGSLLNIKPILTVEDGKVAASGRARGTKKAIKELIDRSQSYAQTHPRPLKISFLHIQDVEAAETLRQELKASGLTYEDMGTYEIGAVIASHAGPGTFGLYMHTEPDA